MSSESGPLIGQRMRNALPSHMIVILLSVPVVVFQRAVQFHPNNDMLQVRWVLLAVEEAKLLQHCNAPTSQLLASFLQ